MIEFTHEIHEDPIPTSWIVGRIDRDYVTIERKVQEDDSIKFGVYNGDRTVLNREVARFDHESGTTPTASRLSRRLARPPSRRLARSWRRPRSG